MEMIEISKTEMCSHLYMVKWFGVKTERKKNKHEGVLISHLCFSQYLIPMTIGL